MKATGWILGALVALAVVPATVVRAQDWPSACGSDAVQYTAKTSKEAFSASTVNSGSAKVVFVEDLNGPFNPSVIVRFAVDGKWVGAGRGKSYFSIILPPGRHSFCGSRQSKASMEKDNRGDLTQTLEGGKTYYFALSLTRTEGDVERGGAAGANGLGGRSDMEIRNGDTPDTSSFKQLTEAQAADILKHSQLSTSNPK